MSYYFHKNWTIDTNPNNGVRLPMPAVFLVVPILGALFLMFLPVIGFVLLGHTIAVRIKELGVELFTATTAPVATGEAHLTGKPVDPLDAIEKEVSHKRQK